MKKLLSLVLCILFVLTALASCGGSKYDLSKIEVENYYSDRIDDEAELSDVIDHKIFLRDNVLEFDVYFEDGIDIYSVDLKSLSFSYRKNGAEKVTIGIRSEDVDVKAIMNLTGDKRVKKIVLTDPPIR